MKPEVIMHNSISLDGRVTGFVANMGLHYGIINEYGADFYMAGSNTAKTGVELLGEIPVETEADYCKPEKGQNLSYWVIPDTKGSLKGMLHTFRRYEYCKDVILLISRQTNRDYIDYLEERHYDCLVCGDKFVDYKEAFKSLLIHPFLVGNNFPNVFEKLDLDKFNMGLKLEKQGTLENDYLQMVWQVINDK